MGEEPKILIVMFNFDDGKEEDEEEAEEALREGEQGGEVPSESIIVALRSNFTDDEIEHLDQIIPLVDSYVGMPFMTCLTTTNLTRHIMVLFFRTYLSFCPKF
jgi:hypothetical protein